MQLADFLDRHSISDAAFAARIGVSRQAIGRYKAGERRPEWGVLDRIQRETNGAVTPNDFLTGDAAASAAAPAPARAR